MSLLYNIYYLDFSIKNWNSSEKLLGKIPSCQEHTVILHTFISFVNVTGEAYVEMFACGGEQNVFCWKYDFSNCHSVSAG